MLILPVMSRAADNGAHITLDGKELELTADAGIETVSGSIMVPLRLVTENMGYTVGYDNQTETVTINNAESTIKLVVGEATAEVNGAQVPMLVPAKFSGDGASKATLVPLRFVGEQTGAQVGWDNRTKTVYITSAAQDNQDTVLTADGSSEGAEAAPASAESDSSSQLTGLSFGEGRLILAVKGGVTPSVFKMSSPDRIVVDLADTSFSEDFSSSLPLSDTLSGKIDITEISQVQDVRYALFSRDPDAVRVVLDLSGPADYQVTDDKDGLITIDLNTSSSSTAGTQQTGGDDQQTSALPAASGKKIVVIDAGHGGTDSGAVSLNKRLEKDFTLAAVLKLQQILEQDSGLEVVLTRNSDTYPMLQDRVKLANSINADVFISIHGNISPDGGTGPNGVETHYTLNRNSEALAKVMQKYLVQSSGMADRGLKTGNLYVTKNTNMPAVLLECGFLSNPKDEAAMYSDEFQQQLAEGIAAGIKEFLAAS
ncbi:N-acetylmuramoyl-L-alanine amidase family protein [Paenibacillus pinistramenti]|uniref:N-acetylmuramoyl-L-alanine amidase family protein n=1 Tax=Paenibacillus pinistramenti TaxID=1768003 RepID=UPI001396C4C9|nr:N-acetylmuramoyl-L-alanine amidase family protein [Paenibacillus pinistramenti]